MAPESELLALRIRLEDASARRGNTASKSSSSRRSRSLFRPVQFEARFWPPSSAWAARSADRPYASRSRSRPHPAACDTVEGLVPHGPRRWLAALISENRPSREGGAALRRRGIRPARKACERHARRAWPGLRMDPSRRRWRIHQHAVAASPSRSQRPRRCRRPLHQHRPRVLEISAGSTWYGGTGEPIGAAAITRRTSPRADAPGRSSECNLKSSRRRPGARRGKGLPTREQGLLSPSTSTSPDCAVEHSRASGRGGPRRRRCSSLRVGRRGSVRLQQVEQVRPSGSCPVHRRSATVTISAAGGVGAARVCSKSRLDGAVSRRDDGLPAMIRGSLVWGWDPLGIMDPKSSTDGLES